MGGSCGGGYSGGKTSGVDEVKSTVIENTLSGNEAIFFTLQKMREMIEKYKTNPQMISLFSTLLSGIDGRDSMRVMKAVYDFSISRVRYQKDGVGVERLQSPVRTLALGFGDCDDFSILAAVLLEIAGIPARLAVVSTRPDKVFHHVFVQGYSGKEWVSIDPVEKFFGLGYLVQISNYHIEGGEKDMRLQMLEGLSGYYPYPVVMGMGNLGFLKKIKKAVKVVKKVAAPIVKNPITQAAFQVAKVIPAVNIANQAFKTVSAAASGKNVMNAVIKNASGIVKNLPGGQAIQTAVKNAVPVFKTVAPVFKAGQAVNSMVKAGFPASVPIQKRAVKRTAKRKVKYSVDQALKAV